MSSLIILILEVLVCQTKHGFLVLTDAGDKCVHEESKRIRRALAEKLRKESIS